MEWLLTHEPGVDSKETAEYSPDAIKSLENMGFSSEQAKAALSACQGSLERAVDWLFSHADAMEASVPFEATNLDGRGEYELVGFLSHMGKNTSCGHYVCHIKKVKYICMCTIKKNFSILTYVKFIPRRMENGLFSTTRKWQSQRIRPLNLDTCTFTKECINILDLLCE